MFALNDSQKFYLYSKPTDMRKSFNGLYGLIVRAMQKNPLSGDVYIFINKRRDMMKILHWQHGGFMLYFKRLEKGTFEIPKQENKDEEIKISYTKLAMIISGISVKNLKKRKRFSK